jgi:hypothetical protein
MATARDGETVALRLNSDTVSYPYFGEGLDRRIVYVDDEGGSLRTRTGSSSPPG